MPLKQHCWKQCRCVVRWKKEFSPTFLRTEVGMSRAVGKATQQLEKEVQAAASSVVTTSTQHMQALVGTVRGELQAQMEASHQEIKKHNEIIRCDMQKITDDV